MLVEVMVAAAILLTGMLGLLTVLDNANSATTTTKAREQAVSLQREVIEAAHGVAYDKLVNDRIVSEVQSLPGASLEDAGAGAGWTIRRRGVTYTVTLGVCSVDDPYDGLGVHDGTFCATGAGNTSPSTCSSAITAGSGVSGGGSASGVTVGDCGLDINQDGTVDNLTSSEVGCVANGCGGTADSNPDDYKRIVSLVRWDRGGGKRFALQATTVSNPGLSAAPSVTDVALNGTSLNGQGEVGPEATSVGFRATFDRAPATAAWYLDGTVKSTVSAPGASWDFSWPLGNVSGTTTPNSDEVLDGTYAVSVKAFDQYGNYNNQRAYTVKLNRRQPYPPPAFEAGRNGSVVEFEWRPNKERDIKGYRVYRMDAGTPTLVCSLTSNTACQDTSPPDADSVEYYAVAVDTDGTGALRNGDETTPHDFVKKTNNPPTKPGPCSVTSVGGYPRLSWGLSSDPDAGDSVDFYRIYRDGSTFNDRYDRTQTGADSSYDDTRSTGTHIYGVVAVDTNLAESPMTPCT